MEAVKKHRGGEGPDVEPDCDDESSSGRSQQPSDSSEAESTEDPQMELELEFEARAVEEDDFNGIRRFLQQLLQGASVDVSGLTTLAIKESKAYGCTIKLGGEDEVGMECEDGEAESNEVCGVTTFIPLTQNKNLNCVQQLMEHLLVQCKHHRSSEFKQLAELLQDSKRPIGLLVNERFPNLPVKLGSLALQTLLKELKDAVPSSGVCELVAILARSCMTESSAPVVGTKRKDRDLLPPQEKQLVFDYFENEFFEKDCLLSFSYPVWTESELTPAGDGPDIPFRTLIVLPYFKLEHALSALDQFISH